MGKHVDALVVDVWFGVLVVGTTVVVVVVGFLV